MTDSIALYSVLVPTAAVAGLVRGFAGFGGPLVLLPVLSLFLPPASAVAAMLWIDLFANIAVLRDARRDASASVVVPLTVGTLIAMPLGAWLLVVADADIMRRTLCAAVFVAAVTMLSGWRYRGPTGPRVYAGVGLGAGVVIGATGLAVTAALFLNAGHQTARQARANFIVWVFIMTIVLLALFAARGTLSWDDAPLIAALSVIYLAGTIVGTRAHYRANDVVVRRAVLGLVLVIASTGLIF